MINSLICSVRGLNHGCYLTFCHVLFVRSLPRAICDCGTSTTSLLRLDGVTTSLLSSGGVTTSLLSLGEVQPFQFLQDHIREQICC